MRARDLLVACLVLAGCNSGSDNETPSSTPRYVASRLSVVDNNFFGSSGINGRGDVAGYGSTFPLITWDGNLEQLQKPTGADVARAVALNDSKQIIGYGQSGPQISRVYIGFLITAGVTQTFPNALPADINSRGDVVGLNMGGGDSAGFLFLGNAMAQLPDKSAKPVRINDRGDVVGSFTPAGSPNTMFDHPFVYSGGKLTDLGVAGAALDINARGDIVGRFYPNPEADISLTHAFVYTKGVLTDLGTLGGTRSEAIRIDDAGRIVGSISSAVAPSSPFLYVQGMVYDLKSLIVSGVSPEDIPIGLVGVLDMNPNGQILVTICAIECRSAHTYLLYPN